jgi:hypothetical protein
MSCRYLFLLLVAGCAANSGVVPAGEDSYFVSRQAATGLSGMGTLKADALKEANNYCSAQQKSVFVINSTESNPPYIFGNFPKVEIQFKCVLASDVEPTK